MKKIISFILCTICLATFAYGVEIIDDTVIGCTAHTENEINIPFGAREIEKAAFKGCAHIEQVILPKTISRVGEGAFEGTDFAENVSNYTEGMLIVNGVLIKVAPNTEIVRVPENVRLIADGAFRDANLKELYLPESIEKFSINAFYSLAHKVSIHYAGDYDEFSALSDFELDKINLHTDDEMQSLMWIALLVLAALAVVLGITYPWKEEE